MPGRAGKGGSTCPLLAPGVQVQPGDRERRRVGTRHHEEARPEGSQGPMIRGSSVHGRDRRWLHRKWAPGAGGGSRQAWYRGWRNPSHGGVILCRSMDPAGKSGGAGAHREAAIHPPRCARIPDNHSLATLPRTRGTILNTTLFPPRPRDLAGHQRWLSEAEYSASRPLNPTPTTTDPRLLRLGIHGAFSGHLMRFHWFVIFFAKYMI